MMLCGEAELEMIFSWISETVQLYNVKVHVF